MIKMKLFKRKINKIKRFEAFLLHAQQRKW